MHITKALFQRIVNHPGDLPPEEGGIIGCTGNAGAKIIDIVEFGQLPSTQRVLGLKAGFVL